VEVAAEMLREIECGQGGPPTLRPQGFGVTALVPRR
jgi:hypothetical protein